MKKIANLHFLKNQLFRFLIIFLVIFNLQEHTIHQNKAEDISFTGAALGRVPWVPVNPWISRNYAKESLKLKIKSDSQ